MPLSRAQQYIQTFSGLGASSSSVASELSASLQWANSRTLTSGGTLKESWADNVRQAFDPKAITDEVGVSQTIAAPKVSFSIPSGQQVSSQWSCQFGVGMTQPGSA